MHIAKDCWDNKNNDKDKDKGKDKSKNKNKKKNKDKLTEASIQLNNDLSEAFTLNNLKFLLLSITSN